MLFKGAVLFNKETIRKMLESTDHFLGKLFTFTVQSLIVVSLITFSIDTLPDLSLYFKNILNII